MWAEEGVTVEVQPALLGSVMGELGLGRGDSQEEGGGTSLVVQWLLLRLARQGVMFEPLLES